MKRYLLGIALLAQPALAASMSQAEFAPGTTVPAKVVVSEALWSCADSRCSGPGDSRAVAMQRACNALARQVGPIVALSVGAAALTPDAIQACNAKAGRTAAAVAAR